MKLIDFLSNIDFRTEYVSINFGEKECYQTSFFPSDSVIPEVKTDIEGFISIIEGEKVISFRPEAVTHFYKGKRAKKDTI